MSSSRVLPAALAVALVLVASMFIFNAGCTEVFAEESPTAQVTVDFGANHADLAQTVATAINENSGRVGSDYAPYNEYGPLQCTVNESVISLDFPTATGDELVKEGQVYAFFLDVTYKAIEKTDYKDQGEHFLSVGKKTIDKYTSNWDVWEEFDNAINNLGEKLSLNALWEKPVTKASFTVTNALCGTQIEVIEHPTTPDSFGYWEQTPEPEVTAGEDSELVFHPDYAPTKLWMNTKDFEPSDLYPDSGKCFSGELTPETEVYVAICPMPKFGYFVDWDSKMDITVNGEKAELLRPEEEEEEEDGSVPVVAKVTVTHDYGPWKYLNDVQHQKVCKHDPTHVLNEDHTWDNGVETKKPTTTTDGEKLFTCTAEGCGATHAVIIPKLDPAKVIVPIAKMKAGKRSITIGWNKVEGADGYDIFFARCNHSGKKIVSKRVKSIKGNNTFNWTKSGLKKGVSYKSYVKAYAIKDGKKKYISKTPIMHAYTGNVKGNYTNARSVILKNVKKGKLSLAENKTFKIKAKVTKVKKNKKLMPSKHVKKLRYKSSNTKVATVTKGGKIIAKGVGECTVAVFAHNGVSKSIKVTVQ